MNYHNYPDIVTIAGRQYFGKIVTEYTNLQYEITGIALVERFEEFELFQSKMLSLIYFLWMLLTGTSRGK